MMRAVEICTPYRKRAQQSKLPLAYNIRSLLNLPFFLVFFFLLIPISAKLIYNNPDEQFSIQT